jgi:hypothetical protein
MSDLKAPETPQLTAEALLEIGRRCASLPDFDQRSADEILGYNEFEAE